MALSRLRVARDRDEHEALVGRPGPNPDLPSREFGLQKFIVGLPFPVLPVDPGALVDVDGGDQLIGPVGELGAPEVDAPLRIGLDLLFLAGRRIEECQCLAIDRLALVRHHVDAPVIGVETDRTARFEDRAGVDLLQAVGIDPQDFCVPVVGDAGRQPQLILEIEDPAGDLLGVLPQQSSLPGRDLHPVEVVPGSVAVVDPDKEAVRIALRNPIDQRADRLRLGQVPGGRDFRPRPFGGGGIDGVDVVVLVSPLILHEEKKPTIAAPEESGDRSLGVIGHQTGRREGLPRPLDPDVARFLEWLDERNELAIRGELRSANLRIPKEQLPIQQGSGRRRCRALCHAAPRDQEQREADAANPGGSSPSQQSASTRQPSPLPDYP